MSEVDAKAYKHRWYLANKVRLAAKNKAWVKAHPERVKEYKREWNKRNQKTDAYKAYRRKYRQRDYVKAAARRYDSSEERRAAAALWRENNRDRIRESKRRYDRKEEVKRKKKEYLKGHPEVRQKAIAKYLSNNSEKRKAHGAISSRKQCGKLVSQPCEVCGDSKSEAHHADYSKPLDVRWLCDKHHKEEHVRLRKQKKTSGKRFVLTED